MKVQGWVQACSISMHGWLPYRRLKLITLRLAMRMSRGSGTHSLWMWALPIHFTRYSASFSQPGATASLSWGEGGSRHVS